MSKFPDYIILGAQRSGTTSLQNYIGTHPDASRCVGDGRREVSFFTFYYDLGVQWYRDQFPSNAITGEKSPYYLHCPVVPERVLSTCSDTKFIVLLRNPVNRAYSDFWLAKRARRESLSFEQAIAREHVRLHEERVQVRKYGYRNSHHHLRAYFDKGLYAVQLRRWFTHFPPACAGRSSQFLVLQSEEFFATPQLTMDTVFAFLGLEPFQLSEFPQYRSRREGPYPPMNEVTRHNLNLSYAEYNVDLERLLERTFNWSQL